MCGGATRKSKWPLRALAIYFLKLAALEKVKFKQDFFFTSRLIFDDQTSVKLAEVIGAMPKLKVCVDLQSKGKSAEEMQEKAARKNRKAVNRMELAAIC